MFRYGEYSFVGEKQLLDSADGAFGGRMAPVRRVAFKSGAEKGSNAALRYISLAPRGDRSAQLT